MFTYIHTHTRARVCACVFACARVCVYACIPFLYINKKCLFLEALQVRENTSEKLRCTPVLSSNVQQIFIAPLYVIQSCIALRGKRTLFATVDYVRGKHTRTHTHTHAHTYICVYIFIIFPLFYDF